MGTCWTCCQCGRDENTVFPDRTARAYCEDCAPTRPLMFDGCARCGSQVHARAIHDPTRCIRCAEPAATYYGWHAAPFGRVRRVRPQEARRWR